MSKEINVGDYDIKYSPKNKQVYCYNRDTYDLIMFDKQDLLDMLALFEEEKTE